MEDIPYSWKSHVVVLRITCEQSQQFKVGINKESDKILTELKRPLFKEVFNGKYEKHGQNTQK